MDDLERTAREIFADELLFAGFGVRAKVMLAGRELPAKEQAAIQAIRRGLRRNCNG